MSGKIPVPGGKEGFATSLFALFVISILLFSHFWVETYLNPSMNSPSAPEIPLLVGSSTNRPNPTLHNSPGYSYDISWRVSRVYERWGGEASIDLKNTGNNTLFVYYLGFSGDWPNSDSYRDVAIHVEPGETRWLGIVAFHGPESSSPTLYRRYNVAVGVMARGIEESSSWYDAGLLYHGDRAFLVEPLVETAPVFQSRMRNELWTKTNALVSPNDPGVQEIVEELRDRYGDGYNVFHVIGAFEWVWSNIEYELEPPGEDYWQMPSETLESRKGDCEDHALLLISIIQALGGSARMNIISGHAFATVYIGATETSARDVWNRIEQYYGTSLNPCWIVNGGIWLSADTLGGFYLGGLPVNSSPIDASAGSWTFTSTMALSIIDT